MISRRQFTAMAAGLGCLADPVKTWAADALATRCRDIERRSGGRLGVCIVDTGNGREFAHRADERFPMCSTFKLMASVFVLWRADLGQERLDRPVPFGAGDLVAYSPVTSLRAADGAMSIGELCEATLTTSDNTAANLILASYGGPAALTSFMRSIGDPVTRLDRVEPALNSFRPGDARDTTSPRAMLASMRRAVLGDLLTPASRDRLQRWMRANTTGGTRLKAGIPQGWEIGDKTGKADTISNDIAVVWPTGRSPLLVTAYLSQGKVSSRAMDAAIAEVGALLGAVLG